MAKKNYEKLAKEIVRYIGGPENVNALVHCATRLRFKVKNTQNVDKKKLEQLEGVITVLDSGGQIQVVIGQHVADVYDTIFEVTDLKKENPSDAEESGEKKNLLNTFMDTISGIFAPVLGVMSGAGYGNLSDSVCGSRWSLYVYPGISGIYCSKKIQSE